MKSSSVPRCPADIDRAIVGDQGDADTPRTSQPIQKRPRRHFPIPWKRELIERHLTTGESIASLAREHDVTQDQIHTWRKAYRQGLYGPPAAIKKCDTVGHPPTPVSSPSPLVELQFPQGRVSVSIDTPPDIIRRIAIALQ